MPDKGRIRIVGSVLKPPICETSEATVVEFYDGFGDLMAVVCRMFSDDTWGLVTKADPDWETTLIRLGYVQPSTTTRELVKKLGTEDDRN